MQDIDPVRCRNLGYHVGVEVNRGSGFVLASIPILALFRNRRN